jgi:nicotinate-nucleotide adenylyltransferase
VSAVRLRIGILGGTFDPIHVGHLALARSARAALSLDELRFVPTGQPWQKHSSQAPAADRLRMVEAAVASLPDADGFSIDDREVRRAGPSYTFDTLTEMRAELGDAALVLILGSDQLHNLSSWYRWSELLDLAHIAFTQRERVPLHDLPEPVEALVARHGRAALPDAPAGAIVFFQMPPVPVSATALRIQLGRGERPAELLPAPVLDYIRSHSLYLRG